MNIDIIKKSEQKTTRWTGGATTELAIHPGGSSYTERNFLWRLSVASIENAESTFTVLPGVARVLMVLEGSLTLQHPGQYTVTLEKFDKDTFSGDEDTVSFGRAMDFNLMTRGTTSGKVEGFSVAENETKDISVSTPITAFYVYKGQIAAVTKNEKYLLDAGDLMLVKEKGMQIELKGMQPTDLAVARINL